MLEVKSLSIVVPQEPCINNCAYCIYEMQGERGGNCLSDDAPNYILSKADYMKRLVFARENGCNSLIITGQCEPQQHRHFLAKLGSMNQSLPNPFPIIDIQTTGAMLDKDYLYFLRVGVGVTIITLQVSAFSDVINQKTIGMPAGGEIELGPLCHIIHDMGFVLRLSLHLTDYFNIYHDMPAQLFRDAKKMFHADQVVLRELSAKGSSSQAQWIREHAASDDVVQLLKNHVLAKGKGLNMLESGKIRYSLMDMSIVMDTQRMPGTYSARDSRPVLRANGRLYSRWDDEGSLIF